MDNGLPRLPITKIWAAGLAFLRTDGVRIANWCLLPFSFLVMVKILDEPLLLVTPMVPKGLQFTYFGGPSPIALVASWALVAVALHRAVLMQRSPASVQLTIDRQFWAYLWIAVKLWAALHLVFAACALVVVGPVFVSLVVFRGTHLLPSPILNPVLQGLIWVLLSLAVAKLSLAFPAVALGEKRSLRSSFELGSGNAFRLCIIWALPCIGLVLLMDQAQEMLGSALRTWLGLLGEALASLIVSAVQTTGVMLAIVLLSLSYLHLRDAEARRAPHVGSVDIESLGAGSPT
ncbi:MAG: hypothetical protein JNK11_01200 [Alphaproteobacteria bacterium]|nr:hypothetical protein [Alphaproteobacteria bacterium]